MSSLAHRISENLAAVRERIVAAARRAGRPEDSVRLLAVTKYVGLPEIRALVEAGCHDLGESRPQHLWEKAEALGDLPVRWHMIGHLQRNKVRRTMPLVAMIHSADSPRLVAAIDECGAGVPPAHLPGREAPPETPACRIPILLEVNISGEPAKHGFAPEAIEPFLTELPGYRHVEVRGLMGMAALEGGLDAARRDFAALRQLRDRLQQRCPAGTTMEELSMGMSGDYEVAIEEGATIVRVGSALFEGVIS